MRDRRFIAEHRGGPLKKPQQYQLMQWALACARHVAPLAGEPLDPRLVDALEVAEAWCLGQASVGQARQASVAAHAAARQAQRPETVAVARAIGHAVATAHMADHALGPAWYGLKAVRAAGASEALERQWQDDQLPPEIRDLVLSARQNRRI